MKIIVSVGVQFMMKDREMDMPKMLPRTTHSSAMEVSVSPELQPYIEEYSKSVNDSTYDPQYEISKVLLDIITPRVKKAYPEHWRKETGLMFSQIITCPRETIFHPLPKSTVSSGFNSVYPTIFSLPSSSTSTIGSDSVFQYE